MFMNHGQLSRYYVLEVVVQFAKLFKDFKFDFEFEAESFLLNIVIN